MNLTKQFDASFHQCNKQSIPWSHLASLMDLTILNLDTTNNELEQLILNAQKYQVAAVCVFPKDLLFIQTSEKLQAGNIKRATVINFPHGNESLAKNLQDIEMVSTITDEIDYVFPYPAYLNGDTKLALANCREVYKHCKSLNLTFKIIIETGVWPSIDNIYKLCREIIDCGADFIKTSTGKIAVGATLPAEFAILKAIKDSQAPCGVKVSGGIKTQESASYFVHLAEHVLEKPTSKEWFRIGISASSFIKLLS